MQARIDFTCMAKDDCHTIRLDSAGAHTFENENPTQRVSTTMSVSKSDHDAPAGGSNETDSNAAILRDELNRRLQLLDELEDSEFGTFTTLDWALCTVFFFFLPLVIAWWFL
jgi:hypothetical protein